MNDNLKATRISGRIVNVGRLAGLTGEIDFNLHALRRITYVGVTFRTRNAAEVEDIVAKTATALGPALAKGELRLPIDKVYRLEDASQAFAHMARNDHFGKLVLANNP
jgi:NADPH:quinone reductase